ncbi:MAG TPA: CoA ester lyase [Candidatus Limnocylindrales bacterium]|nr:CoA ester lyase [Candidatus Limnocylindrales bacterium]
MNINEHPVRPRRSLLFVPGLRPDRFPKALDSGADMVCVDLEDAVALDRKAEARALTLPLFRNPTHSHVEQLVRINSLSTINGLKDIQAITESDTPPPALMIPKVKSAEEIQLLEELLSGPCKHIRFHVIIETNQGLKRVHEIAQASPRVDSLILGAVDMSADLRCSKTWEALLYTRSRMVHAAASAGIDLLDVPYLNLEDEAGLRQEATASASLGFTGKAAIHPKQLAIIHEAFSPSEALIARARKIIEAFNKNPEGLLVVEGELIELPVIRSMYRILAIAERISRKST